MRLTSETRSFGEETSLFRDSVRESNQNAEKRASVLIRGKRGVRFRVILSFLINNRVRARARGVLYPVNYSNNAASRRDEDIRARGRFITRSRRAWNN